MSGYEDVVARTRPERGRGRMMNRFRVVAGVLSVLVLVVMAFPTAAFADVDTRGECSGSAHWELDASHENGRLQMEFEVNSAKAGKSWHVRLSHNGNVFDRLVKITNHEGDFDVDRYVKNRAGTDTLGARAVSRSGQVCRAQVKI
jgi:hypothetical protein